MEKINLVELLRDCPTGMELDCPMYDNVQLACVLEGNVYPIKVQTPDGQVSLNKYGCYSNNKHAKCVIFPKGKNTWEGFHKPFKDGDILFVDCSDDEEDKGFQYIFILKNPKKYGKWHSYCHFGGVADFYSKETYLTDDEYHPRFATEEEKQKLFDAIKANGYKWNAETKTLEKLIEPKFKVGDRIQQHKARDRKDNIYTITKIDDVRYHIEGCPHCYTLPIATQDHYILVPNNFDITTLKPFESKVLVRDYDNRIWIPTFWGKLLKDDSNCRYLTVNGCYKYCIPYVGNWYLLGTTNDCDDFYKTWE